MFFNIIKTPHICGVLIIMIICASYRALDVFGIETSLTIDAVIVPLSFVPQTLTLSPSLISETFILSQLRLTTFAPEVTFTVLATPFIVKVNELSLTLFFKIKIKIKLKFRFLTV